MDSFYARLEEELNQLKRESNYRFDRVIDSSTTTPYIRIDGKEYLNLSSNNYLGLANHPHILQKAVEAIKSFGAGSGSSRVVCGTLQIAKEAERALAKFQQKETAVIFNSGYSANFGVISAVAKRGDLLLCDKLNHASIIDGALHSKAEFKRYRHLDMNHLEDLLKKSNHKQKIIVTDTIFSMDGDVAPLKTLIYLKQKYNAVLMIDEAHSEGVFGKGGRGLGFEYKDDIDIHLGTFGKAFGTFGAYIAGREVLIDYIKNRARSFIYTTALPPSVYASILASLEVVKSNEGDIRRESLHKNFNYLIYRLKEMGFDTLKSQSQIVPILVPTNERAVALSEYLKQKGIFALAIKHPTVPKGLERVRVSLMATHTKEDIEYLLNTLAEVASEYR